MRLFKRNGSLRLSIGGCCAFVPLYCIGSSALFPCNASEHILRPGIVGGGFEQRCRRVETIGIEKTLYFFFIHTGRFLVIGH